MILASLVLACGGGSYQYVGYNMYDVFPLDGQRSWRYANDDISVVYELRVEKVDPPTNLGEWKVYTFEYYDDDTDELLMTVDWSSDDRDGVLIHGYATYDRGADGTTAGGEGSSVTPLPAESVTFDPPLVFAEDQMAPGDAVQTTTGGRTFTSTFVRTEPCPNYWTEEWDSCLLVELDDGDGDTTSGSPVAGSYWLVSRYGVAWMKRTGDPDIWKLRKAEWAPDE